ncbi:MAG TPA: molybdopterin-dependent oxidoreductase [Solirubrobacteraceae bacterium]|jgi:ferredoxin-nitrate reductase|nr:molybdopterin-dependent oxidoreductase [Solirubrobacteraceae bacterium]
MRTLCPYCGTGCGLVVRAKGGQVTTIEGDPIHPVNHGRTCRKPLELASAVHADDRALTPLLRDDRDSRFEPKTWDDALGTLAGRLGSYRPDEIAFYISGQLLTEDYYVVNKLVKGFLGTNNLDSNSRLCMSSAVAGYKGAFGFDGPPPAYADLALSDCLLLLGSNTAACHPILWSRIRERQAEGAYVICVDPRPTPTAREADLHLAVRPGTDLALLNAMLHTIERDGLLDRAFIERSTSGFAGLSAVAADWPPDRAADVCGVAAADIELAAHRFASAGAAMALWSMGANQSTVGTLKNRALINLCLATGQIGRPGAGPLSLTGQPNAMGGRETGGLAHLLPGYRDVTVASDRAEIEAHWSTPGEIDSRPGLTATEIFEPGRLKAIWVVATNPAVSMPDSARVREALEAAELVVVQDAHHPTETSALAHAVLPAAAWPEKEGTMTNSERRVGLVGKLIDPPGDALPDWQIFARLAAALGHGEQFAWADSAAVYDDFAASTAGRPCDVSGLSHERLKRSGSVQWPCPADDGHEGTARLYTNRRFPTADGRAQFAPTPHTPPVEAPGEDFPLTLTTGRISEQWHTMTRTGKAAGLATDGPFVELNPVDAPGVEEGDRVRIVSARGELVGRARLEPKLAAGVVFAPFHFGLLHAPAGDGQLNNATHGAVDPVSGQPELKAAAVRVERIGVRPAAPRRVRTKRLVVVGAGMAGLAVVEEALRRRPTLRVTMLGEEPGPAYNRVLLSKVLAGTAGYADIQMRTADWYAAHGVDMRGGLSATELDLERQVVVDLAGERHPYDALVLATGSRAFVPPIPGSDLKHVQVFRTAADVEALRHAPGRAAVVVGGGLLGLEAAAGLRAQGKMVTVVELADRLMAQQLDGGAAAILRRRLRALGLITLVARSVEEITDDAVILTGGQRMRADLVVLTVGVRAETTLARQAGLECGRGIVVDDELRTSAPRVWAVGECAQHRGTVYGLWAPLADQARVAGAVIAGEPGAFRGTITSTTLKVAGVDVFAGGVADGRDEIVHSDTRRGVYRKLVLQGDSLAGALLVGDTSEARVLSGLLRSGEVVPPEVLAPGATPGPPVAPAASDVVCSCNAVRRGELEKAIRAGGLRTLAQVGRATRAGTGCGGCAADLEEMLDD